MNFLGHILFYLCIPLRQKYDWELSVQNRDRRVMDENLLKFLNKFKSSDLSVLDDNDIKSLSSDCKTDLQSCLSHRLLALEKYERKIKTVECTNGVFVWYILDHLGESLKNYRNVARQKQAILQQYVTCLARMLSVMYMAKTSIHQWLLAVYVRLFAVTKMKHHYNSMEKNEILYNLYGDQQLSSSLSEFIDKCRKTEYLQMENDNLPLLESRNQKTFSAVYELYNDDEYAYVYQYADYFDLQKIALSNLFGKFGRVLFENLPGDRDRWTYAIDRFSVAENRISTAYITYLWIRNPFQYTEYHFIFTDLLYTKFLYLIWCHLKTCQGTSCKCLDLLGKYFKTLAEAFDANDKFLSSLFAFLGTRKQISIKVLEIKVKDELVNRLTRLTGGIDWVDVLNSVPIVHDDHTADIKSQQVLQNINNLKNLIDSIQLALNPFSLYFITFTSQCHN